jgi:hypothetical protein
MSKQKLPQLCKIQNFIILILLSGTTTAVFSTPVPATFAIKPQFDDADDFSEGLARVGFGTTPENEATYGYRKIDSYGYINRKGKVVIPVQYKQAGNFSGGLAWVGTDANGDGKVDLYGYIDKTGKQIIKPQFTEAGNFSLGLAPVTLNSQTGYINKKGKFVLKLKYQYLGEFREGLALVGISQQKSDFSNELKYGYINRRGKLVIPFKFAEARSFSEGLALATHISRANQGYIHKKGKFVLTNPKFDLFVAGEFAQGLAVAELSRGACSAAAYCEYKYINRQGKVVLKPTTGNWTGARKFASGLAPVATGGGGRDAGGFYPVTNWGYINRQGKFVIAPQFDDAGSFSEGLARVAFKGKYGYIALPK